MVEKIDKMPLDTSRIRALCFDVDGTLSDTDDQWVQRLTKLVSPGKFLIPRRDPQAFARWIIMGTETPANLLYTFFDTVHLDGGVVRLLHAIQRRQKRRPPKKFWLIPFVDEALNNLSKRFPMSVVSARDEWTTLAFLDQFGFRNLFASIVTSQTCEFTKPYPHPVLFAAQQMGVSPDECLMVGDTVVDILAGKQAGAQTAGVLCGFGERNELKRAGADIIIESTALLPDLFLNRT